MDLAHSMFKSEMFEIDTMQPKYYRHKLGIDGVWGRNFNLALRDYGKIRFQILEMLLFWKIRISSSE